MSGSITYEQVGYFIALIVGAFTFWFFLERRINNTVRQPSEVAQKALTEIADLKLLIAREYTTNSQATAMEGRIMERLDEMRNDIHAMRESLAKAPTRRKS